MTLETLFISSIQEDINQMVAFRDGESFAKNEILDEIFFAKCRLLAKVARSMGENGLAAMLEKLEGDDYLKLEKMPLAACEHLMGYVKEK